MQNIFVVALWVQLCTFLNANHACLLHLNVSLEQIQEININNFNKFEFDKEMYKKRFQINRSHIE